MNILKRGITGFDKPIEIKEHSEQEIKEFLKCISIPYNYIKTYKIESPHESSNYFRISMINQIKNDRFDILLNTYYWVISSVKIESNWMNLEFLEFDNLLKNQIMNVKPNIEILNVDILNQNASEIEKENLGKTEINQIEYWNSKTYGEIIFNGYD